MREKILLDTDIGSDFDDAFCLAYLLANPACELLGITTVSGEGRKRAQMASALCIQAGKNVPIYVGREEPLLPGPVWQPYCPHAHALSRWEHAVDFPEGEAVEFMRRTIRKYPKEVTLLAIGPMTNIAALFAADAEIPSLLKRLVLMCGSFSVSHPGGKPAEWNARLDPAATSMVYRCTDLLHGGPGIHRSIGLDVTFDLTMPAEEARRRFHHPLLFPVLDFSEIRFETVDKVTFHDPLAAAAIFDDTICGFKRGRVGVETVDASLAGMTRWTADPAGPHEVALTVDNEAFFNHYFSVFR